MQAGSKCAFATIVSLQLFRLLYPPTVPAVGHSCAVRTSTYWLSLFTAFWRFSWLQGSILTAYKVPCNKIVWFLNPMDNLKVKNAANANQEQTSFLQPCCSATFETIEKDDAEGTTTKYKSRTQIPKLTLKKFQHVPTYLLNKFARASVLGSFHARSSHVHGIQACWFKTVCLQPSQFSTHLHGL